MLRCCCFHWLLLHIFQFICMFLNQFWCIQWCTQIMMLWQIANHKMNRCVSASVQAPHTETWVETPLFHSYLTSLVLLSSLLTLWLSRIDIKTFIQLIPSQCHAVSAMVFMLNAIAVSLCSALSADINWLLLPLPLLLLLLDEVNAHSSFFSQRISYKQKRLREISFAHTHKRETCTPKDA